jgi:uncharacterized protein
LQRERSNEKSNLVLLIGLPREAKPHSSMTTAANIDLAHLARELQLPIDKVQRTLELLDAGNTVPFITRFRKDQTGGLNEEQVQHIQLEAAKEKLLAERKATILRSIETQGKLVPDLAAHINSARTLKWLEDVYLPFKPKKQTLATAAREKGLEPLAAQILAADPAAADLQARAAEFISTEKGLASTDDVLGGVRHILAEQFSERPDVRGRLRRIMRRAGVLSSAQIQVTERPDSTAAKAAEPDQQDQAVAADAHQAEPVAINAPPSISETANSENSANPNDALTAMQAEAVVPVEPNDSPTDPDAEHAADLADGGEATLAPDAIASPTSTLATDAGTGSSPIDSGTDSQTAGAGSVAVLEKPPVVDKKISRKRAAKERKRKLFEHAFKDYYEFREPLSRLPPHRVLAINRGERAKVLRVKLECDAEELFHEAARLLIPEGHPHAAFLSDCVRDALHRLVIPSLERELRRELTEEAEEHAVKVFAGNLRKLLLQPPVRGRRVLAVDPAFRSGCKLVALDEFGNVLAHRTIHVIGNEEQRKSARAAFAEFVRPQNIGVVAIGNGTACRETEQLVSEVISNELKDHQIAYVIVNEAGASVYSTSQIGREELPHCDAMLRSAVSIGRRLLDPLSELVKINPANIGVGMYQHDVKAKHLRDSLDAVVNSCVNFVGVDVNTASPSLLSYVSGLNQLTARRLYEYRLEHGPFRSREQFKSVPGIGDATFVQAAGFLKITGGENPLDTTWIHPESYDAACRVLEKLNIPLADVAALSASCSASVCNESTAIEGAQAAAQASIETQHDTDAGGSANAPPSAEANVPPTPSPDVVQTEGGGDGQTVAEMSPEVLSAPSPSVPSPSVPSPSVPSPPPSIDEVASTIRTEAQTQHSSPVVAETPPVTVTRHSLAEHLAKVDVRELSRELGIGELTLLDIVAALSRPGRDPRDDFSPPPLRTGIMKLDDLRPGMELQGTVLNVVDFGAFVDIGISDSALIHISKLADRYIRDPQEVVSVGDVLKVWVINVDKDRRRVSLTAIDPQAPARQRPQRERRPSRPKSAATATTTATASTPARPPARSAPPPRQRQSPPKPAPKPRTPPPPKKPKPVRPITNAMLTGKQPMRSFSDLKQFFEKKKDEPEEEKK